MDTRMDVGFFGFPDFFGGYQDEGFYSLLFWVLLIIIIIIVILWIMFSHLKQFTLFQATRDQKWHPLDDETSGESENVYKEGFTDAYLIIGDKNNKAFSRKEIINISNSRTFNIGDLHYINVWKFEQFPGKPMVIYYHGNNDNISYRKYVVDICRRLRLNLCLIDYRGYGDSSAVPSSEFLLEDAETVYKHITGYYDPENIIIWGESLGGIASIWTAHKYPHKYLILLSTFADTKTIIDNMDAPEMFKSLLKKVSKSKLMENGKWIKDVESDTVIIHSPEDDLLPYVNATMNFNAVSSERKKLINISGPHAHPFFKYENLIDLLNFIRIDEDIVQNREVISEILDIVNNI
jgi:hypothetical protein